MAFIPHVDGEYVEFGVSGLLHNSDLVMYDRKTNSLWGQISGKAIMGPQTGVKLKRVYVAQVSWLQAKTHHNAVQVLQPPTGSRQSYQKDHYVDYFKSDKTMFPVALKDARLLQKTKIHGFIIDDMPVAVTVKHLADEEALLITVKGRKINVVQKSDGTILVKDIKNGETFVPMLTFWFAWYNFNPNTLLFKG